MTVEGTGPVGPVSLTQLLSAGSGVVGMGEGMAAVSDLVALLGAAGVSAEWFNTGHGWQVVLPFKDAEILIQDRESMFSVSDFDCDADVWGFFVRAYRTDPEGIAIEDDDNDGWIYTTLDDAGACESQADIGETVVDLEHEVSEVLDSILRVIETGRVGNVVLERLSDG